MKWGQKWGHTPPLAIPSYWGKLKNACADAMTLADSATGTDTSSTGTCDDAYVVVPAFGTSPNTILTYPFVSPSQTLALRNPKFGNIQIVDTNALVRRTRSNQLLTFADPTWPVFRTFKLSIEKLNATDVANFKTFIQAQAGKQIGLLDYLNRQWQGVITTQESDIVQVYRDTCGWEIAFEFLGTF